ncbi:Integrase family protein [Paraburkholderia ribeironis]|uniref:Integrase family protein n=1 Tax=Paraburkholderia ribeironis TaxID=1247936 RepID=A0A1N7RJK0_9BURK|nr:site-specific integrase [Paraburkholderia ribeironis]SIT35265.1 Integrase family protein [Paraburkholderia ribeironis]
MAKRESKVLSDTQLRHWVNAGEPVAKSDGDGLTFTLSAAGLAAWVLRYRHGGRRGEITLGRYPDVGLAQARKDAAARRVQIANGENPSLIRRREKTAAVTALTVRQLVEDYRIKVLPAKAEKTRLSHNYHLDVFIGPKLGPMLARDVQAGDIIAMVEDAKKPWPTSALMLNTTNRLFAHAAGKRIITSNPCAGIELSAILGPRPPRRQRLMLTEAELRKLLTSVDTVGRQNGLCLRILLATGVRSSELFKARWSEVNLGEDASWTVPAERIKTRASNNAAFTVPLSAHVVGWLEELKNLAAGSDFVLPARQARRKAEAGGDTHQAENTLWAALNRLFDSPLTGVRRFTPHDMRSTIKSHLRAMGVDRDISERVLNHKLAGVEGVYDKGDYLRERRHALELWSQFLHACETGAEWNVTPLRGIAA